MSSIARLFEQAVVSFKNQFSSAPEIAVAAPGRSNLIGEHTDYNDGHVLPIAIDRYLVAAASQRNDRTFRIHSTGLNESFRFVPDQLPSERPRWTSYVIGVVAELERDGYVISGKDILLHGDLPIGSGLSSSAALEVAVATAIERLEGLELADARLVNACRRADHNFVGVNSGPMDQFASRACRAGHAGLLDCRSLELSNRVLPSNVEFLSIYSGIPRSLATSEYNERQSSCQRAVAVLQACYPQIRALRDATLEQVEAQKQVLGDLAYRRARHVVTEQQRVFDVIAAFEANDLARAGRLLIEGHRSLAEDYEVSLPVLDEMIEWLCRQPAVVGARLTGAGFGGSLICVVKAGAVDAQQMSARFIDRFAPSTPETPALWKLRSVDGAKYQPSYRP
jgi:galactokinase